MSLLMLFRSGAHIVIPREPDGKVFILDSTNRFFSGDSPNVNESCVVIINVGPGVTSGTPVLTFTDPLGVLHVGNSDFAFVNLNPIVELFPNNSIPAKGAVVYTFAAGELDMVGTWQVQVRIGSFVSTTVSFKVVPLGQ